MPPTAAAAAVQSPPRAKSIASLTAILTHERNLLHIHLYKARNQHRTSLWFKHLRILKRAVERLIQHLKTTFPDEATRDSGDDSSSSSESGDEADDDDEDIEQLRNKLVADTAFAALLSRLQDTVIPSSYTAFTHLTTSTQYAGLGMVLLGCLARVYTVLKPITPTARHQKPLPLKQPSTKPVKEEEEDLGEVISRESVALLNESHIKPTAHDPVKSKQPKRQTVEIRTVAKDEQDGRYIAARETTASNDTTTSKKRTAIDDLFADL
ncbi:hypothetical protein TWF696_006009 [Orbilia brochopaga]|uniref:RNase MRP protein 1 RNA binding domain-containing protein n=1 Tax=Orbilia brochopaga TaxID=3140254 RepID=A0AAV9UUZ8_9PEZI